MELRDNWHEYHKNIVALAYHLVETGEITSLPELLYFFEKPWKKDDEWHKFERGLENV